MPWTDEAVPMLRVMLGDPDAARYTDAQLAQAAALGARLVLMDRPNPNGYAVSVEGSAITPDPQTLGDDAFLNLLTLRAACVSDRGAAALAAGQAILVADGDSRIDLRGRFGAALALVRDGWCAVYKAALGADLAGRRDGHVGGAVVGPFRRWQGGGV